jgi:hypothetical protein
MIDAFGISKDWWEEPPKEKHELSTGSKVAAGAAAGLGLGAGALLLATRGKAGKAVKVVAKTPKVKTPKVIRNLKLSPQPTAKPAVVVHTGNTVKAPSKALHIPQERIDRQRFLTNQKIENAKKQRLRLTVKQGETPNTSEYPTGMTAKEVDAAADAKYGTEEQILGSTAPDVGPVERRRARRIKAKQFGKPGKNPRIEKNDAQIIAKRILLDMGDDIFKASITGEQGDKRNTKYAFAGMGGYAVGMNVGERVGAHQAGTTYKENRRQANAAMSEFTAKKRTKLQAKWNAPKDKPAKGAPAPKPRVDPKTWKPSLEEIFHVNGQIKGTRQLVRGGQLGGMAGLATGAGALALYRYDKKKRRESPQTQALLDARRADNPVAKAWFRPAKALKPLGRGPGAARVAKQPAAHKPPSFKGFVEYDPLIASQRKRAAVKASFR